jgi:hypothetical protein
MSETGSVIDDPLEELRRREEGRLDALDRRDREAEKSPANVALFGGSEATVNERSVRSRLPVQMQRRRYRRLRQRYGLGQLDAAATVAREWDEAIDVILRRTKYDERWLEETGQLRNNQRKAKVKA